MARFAKRLAIIIPGAMLSSVVFAGCSRAQTEVGPAAGVRVPLSAHGLPAGFFHVDADTKCAGQIIGYRFVVWLDNERVAVGFKGTAQEREIYVR
jgi:hypothetical protein